MKVTVKVLFNSFIDFFRDEGLILAGSISCFFVMTVVPFCLLLVSIFGYLLGGHKGFYDFLLGTLVNLFPAATSEITRELGAVITFKRIGIFTLFIYGVFSYQLYSALEGAVNAVFKQRVRIHHALSGGLFTAIFLEAAKHLFTFYVALKLPQLGSVYGPLSAFIMFLLWIYYSACIFLIGAEVVYNLGREKRV